jgi:hypothetical protein
MANRSVRAALVLLPVAAALASLLLAGCSSGPPPTFTVNGTVVVSDNPAAGENAPVDTGSQVTVTDASGKIIAFTTLNGNAAQGALYTLTFGFTVKVPEGESSYGIHVDGLTGTTQFTEAQMKAGPSLCAGAACNSG